MFIHCKIDILLYKKKTIYLLAKYKHNFMDYTYDKK